MRIGVICLIVLVGGGDRVSAADSARQFLRYVFGAEDVKLEANVWPHDDLWIVHGRKNEAGLAELEEAKLSTGDNEIVWEMVQNSLCIVEVRAGKADPSFLLDQCYMHHRELILQFIYAALTQDQTALRRMTTKSGNVRFDGTKPPASSDLGQYQEIVARMPVVRSSSPAADKISKSVSYRLPLGAKGLVLRLLRRDGSWLIDTDTVVQVPLEVLFK